MSVRERKGCVCVCVCSCICVMATFPTEGAEAAAGSILPLPPPDQTHQAHHKRKSSRAGLHPPRKNQSCFVERLPLRLGGEHTFSGAVYSALWKSNRSVACLHLCKLRKDQRPWVQRLALMSPPLDKGTPLGMVFAMQCGTPNGPEEACAVCDYGERACTGHL